MKIKPIIRIIVFSGVFVLGVPMDLQAQNNTDNQVDQLMEMAIGQMNDRDYEAANVTFRKILKMDAVLPEDLSYLFAETLYMVNQYHNSRSFLDKYIRLAGPTGRYYPQALDLKMYLDDEYELILVCKLCDNRGYRLIPCDHCQGLGTTSSECFYCHGVGINRCEICKGQGVTTSNNAFSENQYFTCSNCQGKGRTVCKVCNGEKIIWESCPECHGTSKTPGKEICNHQKHASMEHLIGSGGN